MLGVLSRVHLCWHHLLTYRCLICIEPCPTSMALPYASLILVSSECPFNAYEHTACRQKGSKNLLQMPWIWRKSSSLSCVIGPRWRKSRDYPLAPFPDSCTGMTCSLGARLYSSAVHVWYCTKHFDNTSNIPDQQILTHNIQHNIIHVYMWHTKQNKVRRCLLPMKSIFW